MSEGPGGPAPVDGRALRWEQHREGRRTELVAATVRAIDQHGPDVRVAEIAAEAGVSKPVLYRYFADKDELHAAVGTWAADEILNAVLPALLDDGPVRDRVLTSVEAYLRVIEEHHQVFLLLVRHRPGGNPLADGRDRITSSVARILANYLRQQGLDPQPADVWAQGVVGIGMGTGEWWLDNRSSMSRETITGYLAAFTWHAFAGSAAEHGVLMGGPDEPAPPAEAQLRGRTRSS